MKKYSTFILLIISTLLAQNTTITGKVVDASNDAPLIGANVILEGTPQGAATIVMVDIPSNKLKMVIIPLWFLIWDLKY